MLSFKDTIILSISYIYANSKPAMSENLIQKILEFQAVSEAIEPSENERGH